MANSNKNIITRLVIMIVISLVIYNLYMFRDDIFYKPKDNLKVVGIENFKGIEDLILIGEVYEVLDDIGNYHSTGILRINIIETNMEYYDPRDKQANYYCIIKNGKAEIYESNLSKVNIGDTLLINIPERITLIYNAATENKKRLGTMIYPRNFFDFIKRKGYQEI